MIKIDKQVEIMANLFRGSSHASMYSKYRVPPPKQLLEYVIGYLQAKIPPPYKQAVDVGCGTGQSTIGLAPFFESVIGSDISAEQIKNAQKQRSHPNVTYKVSVAEKIDLPNSSTQLVSVGQALHWFNIDDFFAEVHRVLVPNGIIAAYGYLIPTPTSKNAKISKELSHLITKHLHDDVLGKYWHANRYNILLERFANVHFPFEDLERPNFIMESNSSVSEYIGYLRSWSAYESLRNENEEKAINLLKDIEERLMKTLGSDTTADKTTFEVFTEYFLVIGRKRC